MGLGHLEGKILDFVKSQEISRWKLLKNSA
jgi:hypothetical protein